MNIYKALALISMLIPISSMGSEKQANTTDEQQDKYLEHQKIGVWLSEIQHPLHLQ